MASRSRAGSGGKILRPRRLARVATPYERPPNAAASSPQNPNWVSKFIFSPTKVIASTAGKFISTVFGPESSSSSSSYSGSGSDSDDESDENDVIDSSVGVDGLTKENDGSDTRKEIPARVENYENKLLIEQLILQESFSWEECIKLISIIRSRVVEDPVHLEAEGAGPSELPNKGLNRDMPDLLNAALMEAKIWLKDKKLGSSQLMEMEYAVGGVDPNMSRNAAEDELGSPVDVAKSYMKERPPWASPCFTDAALGSTTPKRAQLFKEDTPISADDNSLLYTKIKRDPRMSGSWNISEEIRRVRSRATQEMLLSTPSTKFNLSKSKLKSAEDWSSSSFLQQHKNSFHSFTANDSNALGDKAHGSTTNLIDALPQTPALDVAHAASATTMHSSRLENGTPLINPPVLKTSEKDQDLRDSIIPEGQDDGVGDGLGDAKTTLPSEPTDVDTTGGGGSNQQQQYGVVDSMSDGVCSLSKEDLSIEEDGGGGEGPTPNNGSSLKHTTKERGDMEGGERRRRRRRSRRRSSSYGYDDEDEGVRQKKNLTTSAAGLVVVQMGEQTTTCELLSEASVEVPDVDVNVNVNVNENEGDNLEPSPLPQQEQDAAATTTPKRSKKVVLYVKRTTRGKRRSGQSSNN